MLAQIDARSARDARQDAAVELRRDDGAVDLEEDVHRADFLDVLALDAVEPEHLRIALVVRLHLRSEARDVVAAGLGFADAAADRADVFVLDPDLHRVQTTLVIRADRRKDDDEFIGIRRADAEEGVRRDDERTDVQRGTRRRRDPVGVDRHKRFDRVQEIIGRNLRDAEAAVRVVRALDVLIRAEQKDAAVFRLVGLHALEHLLAVVEHHGGGVQGNRLVRNNLRIMPALFRVVLHHIHVVREDLAEAELALVLRLCLGRGRALDSDFLHTKHFFQTVFCYFITLTPFLQVSPFKTA